MHSIIRLSFFRIFLFGLILKTSLLADDTKPSAAAATPAAPDATKLIVDLRTRPPDIQSTGSWPGHLAANESGFIVLGGKGADGKGEMSQTLKTPLDLSKDKFIEVALAVGTKNEVPEIAIAFNDQDDVQYAIRVRIDQVMPQQPVWFRVRLADFKLNDWQKTNTGRKIDWSRIQQWHLQGDWQTEAPFHVLFIALRARP